MKIRTFKEKDRENCKQVCIETCHYPLNKENDIKLLHLLCLEYYINEEPDNCFVAVDEEDNAVGYIICAADYDKYKKTFKEKYLPKVREISYFAYIKKHLEFIIDSKVKKTYPAHMHIDIFASHQKKGLGHKLVDAVVNNLKEKQVKGLFLRCVKTNEKGMNFYKKYGFTLLGTTFAALFVLDLTKK